MGARFLLQMEVTKVQERRIRMNPVYRIRVGDNSPNSCLSYYAHRWTDIEATINTHGLTYINIHGLV